MVAGAAAGGAAAGAAEWRAAFLVLLTNRSLMWYASEHSPKALGGIDMASCTAVQPLRSDGTVSRRRSSLRLEPPFSAVSGAEDVLEVRTLRFCWRLRPLQQGPSTSLATWQSQLMVCLELCRRNAEARRLITMNLGGARDEPGTARGGSDAAARRSERLSQRFLSFSKPKPRPSRTPRADAEDGGGGGAAGGGAGGLEGAPNTAPSLGGLAAMAKRTSFGGALMGGGFSGGGGFGSGGGQRLLGGNAASALSTALSEPAPRSAAAATPTTSAMRDRLSISLDNAPSPPREAPPRQRRPSGVASSLGPATTADGGVWSISIEPAELLIRGAAATAATGGFAISRGGHLRCTCHLEAASAAVGADDGGGASPPRLADGGVATLVGRLEHGGASSPIQNADVLRVELSGMVALHARGDAPSEPTELRLLLPNRTLVLQPASLQRSSMSLSAWHTQLLQHVVPTDAALAALPPPIATPRLTGWLCRRTLAVGGGTEPAWQPLYCRLLPGARLECFAPSDAAASAAHSFARGASLFGGPMRPTTIDVSSFKELGRAPSGKLGTLVCCALGLRQTQRTTFQLVGADRRIEVLDANDEDHLNTWLLALEAELLQMARSRRETVEENRAKAKSARSAKSAKGAAKPAAAAANTFSTAAPLLGGGFEISHAASSFDDEPHRKSWQDVL